MVKIVMFCINMYIMSLCIYVISCRDDIMEVGVGVIDTEMPIRVVIISIVVYVIKSNECPGTL